MLTVDKPIAVIGAGAAGLITAHILLKDGFKNVQIITHDADVGGVWSTERVYPGLLINKYVPPLFECPCFTGANRLYFAAFMENMHSRVFLCRYLRTLQLLVVV
jgi:glycine/D-amino acid oxidase-like deaminating enzyme